MFALLFRVCLLNCGFPASVGVIDFIDCFWCLYVWGFSVILLGFWFMLLKFAYVILFF